MTEGTAFIDLAAQQVRIRPALDLAIARVLAHGHYIMGPEVFELEVRLCHISGAMYCVSCASGTDALALALMALGLRRREAVLVPSFTFAASAEVIPWLGAVPVFIDVCPDTFNLDPSGIEAGVAAARRAGHRPVGIIVVDLFGQPADYDAIDEVARTYGLWVLADAAQSFGASWGGRRVGTLARVTTTSFFPAKPLGGYGDGGAVFTDDPDLAMVMRSLRVHGQGENKYDNVRIGMNARLDTLQAAILLAKLEIFPDEILARQRAAARYDGLRAGSVATPSVRNEARSTWAQYTVRSSERDALKLRLAAKGIPSAIYYRRPLHQQSAYRDYPVADGGCPIAERLASQVLSLPMHPYLDVATQEEIARAISTTDAAPQK